MERSARILKVQIDAEGAIRISERSRGTPRVANARLWWARNYATSEADGKITLDMAKAALAMAEVDGEAAATEEPAATPAAPKPKKIARKRTTAPPPGPNAPLPQAAAPAAQSAQQSPSPFPAPLPGGTFTR